LSYGAKAKGLSVLSALSAGRQRRRRRRASLTPSGDAASDGERKALDALQAGEHSALHADLMLVRTDAIVCVQPPPVGNLAWRYSVEAQGVSSIRL